MNMAYEFDLPASQKRIERIDDTIRAQKLFIVAVALERKAEAELNLRTLESMRIRLGNPKALPEHERDGLAQIVDRQVESENGSADLLDALP